MDTEAIELTVYHDAEPCTLTAVEGTTPYRQHLELEADEVINRVSYPPADEGFAAWSFVSHPSMLAEIPHNGVCLQHCSLSLRS